MKQILIIQTAFLGDVILATPVLEELHRLFPEAKIDFLVKKGNESLLKNHPFLNHVFVFDKSKGKWKSMRKLIGTFRKNNYDLVVNLQRFASSGILTVLSGGKQKFGFKKNPLSLFFTKRFAHEIGDGTHEVERNLRLIACFGAITKTRPKLYPSPEDYAQVSNYQQNEFYCFAPASVWFTKQLPKEKWVELSMQFKGKKIYLLGAPSDNALCEEIKSQSAHSDIVNLAGKLSLLQSAALMEKATRSFVNDSGPLHLASATNAPVTAFFCSTVPDFGFGPLSDDATIQEVKNLSCRPCGLHGYTSCPKKHFNCGNILLQ